MLLTVPSVDDVAHHREQRRGIQSMSSIAYYGRSNGVCAQSSGAGRAVGGLSFEQTSRKIIIIAMVPRYSPIGAATTMTMVL